jgi:hypothetical protein
MLNKFQIMRKKREELKEKELKDKYLKEQKLLNNDEPTLADINYELYI